MTPIRKRLAAYVRVSTGSQDTTNQIEEIQTWAQWHQAEIAEVFTDHALSGAKKRDKRPALDRMMNAATARKFDGVVCWSLDRLGRSLPHLLELVAELHEAKVEFIAIKQNFDTRTPVGRLMLGILGSLSEYERELIAERVRAGQARAKRAGVKFGRPRIAPDLRRRILERHAKGESMGIIAKAIGVGRATVHREIMATKPACDSVSILPQDSVVPEASTVVIDQEGAMSATG
jgi:DNA invertase Pin-like site-specific DNA recombinase